MKRSGKMSKHQCGFKKDHRTEDNIFLLKSMHEKYVKTRKQKVYLAFVDFSKFFDKINRHMMLYKLLKYGISGKLYNLIKSVYSNTGYCIRIGDYHSPLFHASNGLKQGCCLSPTLSNIFQNDLHDIFDASCDPLLISTTALNSLSWADDLVLASLSENGLKSCLLKLENYCKTWGLEVNVKKTKIMILGKTFTKNESFRLNSLPIENVKTIQYLGFEISYNGNINTMINDRIIKARKVANMVLQALKTDRNVSASLAMSIFDKQIAPILLYGCPIWCLPQSHNLVYIEGQPENLITRNVTNQAFETALGHPVQFEYARRVGKNIPNQKRRILVKLKSLSDKENILRSDCSSYKFTNFEMKSYSDMEKMHVDFCKRSLNMSKFCSSSAIYCELGVFPIEHQALSLAIKYWLRLVKGTDNSLLNECYKESVEGNFEWLQGIRAILNINGFGNVWLNPESVHSEYFHKIFKQRLNDEFVQNLSTKIASSTRFELLHNLTTDNVKFARKNYINLIKSSDARDTYTRLRIDSHILETSQAKLNNSSDGICKNCAHNNMETPEHFLLHCEKFNSERKKAFDELVNIDINFNSMNSNRRIKYILDLRCPDECISICIRYVTNVYRCRKDLENE